MNNNDFNSITIGNWNQKFLNFLKLLEIKTVVLNYSGGGDSGGVDFIETSPKSINKNIKDVINDLEEALSSPIYNRHGGFADGGGYSVNGQVIYNASNNTVIISGTDHHTNYSYNESNDEYETGENWAEDWEEVLYDSDTDSDYKGVSYELAYYYAWAKDQKFSEEIHNRILAEATINDDDWAKKYLDLFR